MQRRKCRPCSYIPKHLTLKITDILFVLPLLPLRNILVVEGLLQLPKVPKRLPREQIKSAIGDAFKTGWEYTAQEQVIVRVNRHLVLVLAEVLDRIGCC